MATSFRWRDGDIFFGKPGLQLSEIFWEGLEDLLGRLGYLLTGNIELQFVDRYAARYAAAIKDKTQALDNFIGFIDGTVLKIARPRNYGLQNVVYNGHMRTHGLNIQAVTTADGTFLHAAGPLEGRRHQWTLYVRSGLGAHLKDVMVANGEQHCFYGDSGYIWDLYLETTFQDAAFFDSHLARRTSIKMQ